MKGRKRHIIVDSQGWLVRVLVHPANWADSDGARHLLRRVPLFARWTKLLLDGGYDTPCSTGVITCWASALRLSDVTNGTPSSCCLSAGLSSAPSLGWANIDV